jgi:hypothetical protein
MKAPSWVRDEGNRFYDMVYGGCVWQIMVGSQRLTANLKQLALSLERLILPIASIDSYIPGAEFFKATSDLITRNIHLNVN